MVLPQMLLDKLACPGCKGKLQYEPEKSRLLCMKCKLEYKIENDIPVLLVSEAAKIK